jgi:hypothetical protein
MQDKETVCGFLYNRVQIYVQSLISLLILLNSKNAGNKPAKALNILRLPNIQKDTPNKLYSINC